MSWEESVERFARFGYLCKGFVYAVMGLLAAGTIVNRGQIGDRQGAFRWILDKPFGRLVLIIMAVGLVGYAVWRVLSGIDDSERRGRDAKGIAIRIGSVARGLFYAWVASELALLVLRHRGGKGSDIQARHWTARAMDEPFGRWLVAIAGACVVGYCGYQLYRAITGKLSKKIRTRSIPPWLIAVSRFGLGARAIIAGVIGASLIRAAIHYSPAQARGTTGAMRSLAAQPFGAVLLALTGLGLAAYGVYAFVNARYRDIRAN
jgi:hypothetical protein